MASWFYLTLKREAPPEIISDADISIEIKKEVSAIIQRTNEPDTSVESSENISMGIQMKNETDVMIEITDHPAAQIDEQEDIDIDVVTRTEVEWIVGRT